MHFSGRGKTSGLEVGAIAMKRANLFHLRGDKVTRGICLESAPCGYIGIARMTAHRPQ